MTIRIFKEELWQDKMKSKSEAVCKVEYDRKGRVKKSTAKGRRKRAEREAKRKRELAYRKERQEMLAKCMAYSKEIHEDALKEKSQLA